MYSEWATLKTKKTIPQTGITISGRDERCHAVSVTDNHRLSLKGSRSDRPLLNGSEKCLGFFVFSQRAIWNSQKPLQLTRSTNFGRYIWHQAVPVTDELRMSLTGCRSGRPSLNDTKMRSFFQYFERVPWIAKKTLPLRRKTNSGRDV